MDGPLVDRPPTPLRTTPLRKMARATAIAALALFALAGCDAGQQPYEYYLSSPLVPVTAGGTGSGQLSAVLLPWGASFRVVVSGLAPDTAYALAADGMPIAPLDTDASGAGQVHAPIRALGIDPRTHAFTVRAPDGTDVLRMAAPGEEGAGAVQMLEYASLVDFGSGASGNVVTQTTPAGGLSATVEVSNLAAGRYSLSIDGVPRATVDAPGAAVVFTGDGAGSALPLDFDPDSAMFVLTDTGGLPMLIGTGHASIEGFDWCRTSTAQQAMLAAAAGAADASYSTDSTCGHGFGVAVRDVPMGDYDLFVGSAWRATISVGADQTGATEGDVAFTSDGRGLQLDFDPRGAAVEVRDGVGDVAFSIDCFRP
jgi:hypothetical protein